jgi:hypothetical protein
MAALAFAVAGAIKAPGSDLDDVFISEDAGVFLAALKVSESPLRLDQLGLICRLLP